MTRTLSRIAYWGCLIIPSFVCLILVFAGACNIVSWMQEETEAKTKLESALKTIPTVPDDVLIETASGKESGGTIGCISYHIEQVRGTNGFNISEVLDFYSSQLPLCEWRPGSVYKDARIFGRVGDVSLAVSEVGEVYWYYLHPFHSFPSSEEAVYPSIQKINEVKRSFNTVFAISLVTYPPVDDKQCRGG